jgi:hypothetical protein
MNFAKFLLVALLILAGVNASRAAIRIADDRGGRIGSYRDKYEAIRTSGHLELFSATQSLLMDTWGMTLRILASP